MLNRLIQIIETPKQALMAVPAVTATGYVPEFLNVMLKKEK